MTSPTRPVNIVSPRLSSPAGFGTPASRRGPASRASPAGTPYSAAGTPDLRSLRAQYIGTPPLPNIPTRTGTPRPSTSTEPLAFAGGGPRNLPAVSGISARRPTGIGLGFPDAPSPDPSVDIESLQEDDRVKVLRKHLVSREERQGSSGVPSRQVSTTNLASEFQVDSHAFPVPYHTPGADITYVSQPGAPRSVLPP
jgi:proton-coupled amino acid transporter